MVLFGFDISPLKSNKGHEIQNLVDWLLHGNDGIMPNILF
jgi:hypothetical protein